MCGITGIIQQNNQSVSKFELDKMNHLVAHRGPDDSGHFLHHSIGLAHRRLSILDLSKKGQQPMRLQHLVLTFNGEIYNFLELKKVLIENGYSFQTKTDTEVVLNAYLHWGQDCVQHFNGMWAFALLDLNKQKLFCSRDRFGIKPFYYANIEEKFCFGSEIKQFYAIENWVSQINQLRAYEFLVYGWHDHTSETFFKDIFQLPQGCNLIYNLKNHDWAIEKYYDLASKINQNNTSTLSKKAAILEFQNLFTSAIKLRLRADVKTGSALSGGLDSSSIVGTVAAQLTLENQSAIQETVSACFQDKRFDESEYVDAVSKTANVLTHKVFPSSNRLWETLEIVTRHQDEPIASASVFAQYLVFEKAAKEGIKVMLDGQGADEILAGYDKFYAPYFKNLLVQNPRKAMREFYHYFRLHTVSFSQIIQAIKPPKNTALQKYFHPSFVPKEDAIFNRSADTSIKKCAQNLLFEIGLPILLHYEDRNSMAHSVESRVPFLDYRLVEFCLNLPDNLKIKQGKRKYILRESMKEVLPKKVYERYDKMGFVTPQVIWMEAHSEWILEKIKAAVQRENDIFEVYLIDFAEVVFKEKKRADYAFLWRVLAFEIWLEVFKLK
ncbi:MAG: asparagine synthase (glutamine-hydrolyzing) [Saprospiraceae bacterium]|jgi:asparagine synthase (glutamine-hydrolysing)